MVNFLTAARLYLDQLPQNIANCLPFNGTAPSLIKARCSQEYGQHFEYRFMEALRNHAQHRGIPIHFVLQGARWTPYEESGRMECTIDMVPQRRYLEDEKFKKLILQEVLGDVDLTAACRRYIESLSAINQFARNLTADSVRALRQTIERIHKRYSGLYSGSLVGLTVLTFKEGRETSSVPLLIDWDDVCVELQKRNGQLVNLRKRYVTVRTLDDRIM